jgi:hypothetical protein
MTGMRRGPTMCQASRFKLQSAGQIEKAQFPLLELKIQSESSDLGGFDSLDSQICTFGDTDAQLWWRRVIWDALKPRR